MMAERSMLIYSIILLLGHVLSGAGQEVAENGSEPEGDGADFRLIFILLLVVLLGLAAAVIICRFCWVNFLSNKYDKVPQDDELSSVVIESDTESTKKPPLDDTSPNPDPQVDTENDDPFLTSEKAMLLAEDQAEDPKESPENVEERTPSSQGTPPPPYEDGSSGDRSRSTDRGRSTESSPERSSGNQSTPDELDDHPKSDDEVHSPARDVSPSRDGILHLGSPMLIPSREPEEDKPQQAAPLEPIVEQPHEIAIDPHERDNDADSESSETSASSYQNYETLPRSDRDSSVPPEPDLERDSPSPQPVAPDTHPGEEHSASSDDEVMPPPVENIHSSSDEDGEEPAATAVPEEKPESVPPKKAVAFVAPVQDSSSSDEDTEEPVVMEHGNTAPHEVEPTPAVEEIPPAYSEEPTEVNTSPEEERPKKKKVPTATLR